MAETAATPGLKYDMVKEEKKWQAKMDARTLGEAEVIKGDPERLKAAQAAAKRLADEKEEEAKGMNTVASLKYKE